MVPDGVFLSHLQAGRNSTEFWTLPSLKSALQNHEGPTETRKGHSAHGRKAPSKIKPISDTEGMNHYSPSANKQPINEWINQSIDRSIGRSTNQSNIDGSNNQSINRLINLSINPNSSANNLIKNIWQTGHKASKQQNIRSSTVPCTVQQLSLWGKEKRKQQNKAIAIPPLEFNASLPYK